MEEKYFMHRIKKENGSFVKGIEVHDTRDSAILSFWSYQVYAYGNPDYPNVTFVSCMITDNYGNVLQPYDITWRSPDADMSEIYFMHHIRKDGDSFNKDIDICDTIDSARLAYSKALAYGYNNSKFPNVQLVSCMITAGWGEISAAETWVRPEPAAEPEPEEPEA